MLNSLQYNDTQIYGDGKTSSSHLSCSETSITLPWKIAHILKSSSPMHFKALNCSILSIVSALPSKCCFIWSVVFYRFPNRVLQQRCCQASHSLTAPFPRDSPLCLASQPISLALHTRIKVANENVCDFASFLDCYSTVFIYHLMFLCTFSVLFSDQCI